MSTIDLDTDIIRPSDRLDYITKQTSCAAAARGTPHPLWTAFLNRIFAGNVELQEFLQRFMGYCLTGFVHEHKFVFAYGTGANGKSTFINTIVAILGDYATTADMNTFLVSNTERHPTDLAKLQGARLVVAHETQKGRKWDEAKIKTLTGGDKITARFMRQDYFDFDPTFKLFIVGNHKPRLGNVDEAIKRRLLFIPFTVQIPEAERDPDLLLKLEAEHPAILRWMIDGCSEWRKRGLDVPAIVNDATSAYLADQDTIAEWMDACVNTEAGIFAFTTTADLFHSWKQWCDLRNLSSGSTQTLSETLEARGLEKAKHAKNRRMGFRAELVSVA